MKPYGNYRKLYESLRRYDSQQVAVQRMEDLAEIEEIWRYYEKLSIDELRLIGAAIKKTEAQLGYIPFCFSTVPFVFLVFSAKLSTMITSNLIVLFLAIVTLASIAIYLIHRHFTHKSYNALHLHIVEALLHLKKDEDGKEKNDEDEKAEEDDEKKDDQPEPISSLSCGSASSASSS
ncbi:hypothetical protein LOK74_02910 [Brevibacillus humidisoli]|uniref:hypothetical protein n=1 Tax=Brevibacillus humidisoli TaxID=2895522 RepID=UPI001E46EF4E|nr:hypothetical protein [Brevibacillus humidisoli]UFJ41504.1 hypothetical protein LOK74_02910 [Brevibacillus humidisoli]